MPDWRAIALPSPWRALRYCCRPVELGAELVLLDGTAPIALRAVALIRLHQAPAAALIAPLRSLLALLLRLLLRVSLR
ncbi:MAG: hypothetical protein ABSC02_07940 [Acidobacteriota bacterium]